METKKDVTFNPGLPYTEKNTKNPNNITGAPVLHMEFSDVLN